MSEEKKGVNELVKDALMKQFMEKVGKGELKADEMFKLIVLMKAIEQM